MAEALKHWISVEVVTDLAAAVAEIDRAADVDKLSTIAAALEDLELKDRVNLVADALAESLSGSHADKMMVAVELAASGRFEGMTGWPLASLIERHGLGDPPAALQAMTKLTEYFSCEFAVRPFLIEHLDQTMAQVHAWTDSPSEHPRRLASEGTRPKLPWGPDVPALLADPTIGLAVLEKLRHDPSEYVRRSVANHLNDVAKADPELVVETAARWSAEPETAEPMITRALRTLVKNGHPGAMEVLGFSSEPTLVVDGFTVSPSEVTLGQSIEIVAVLTSVADTEQRFVVDFVIHHVLANGRTSPKVFKWTTPTLAPGATIELRKKRKIATASTRRYHPGYHQVDLQIAGTSLAQGGFELPVGS